MNPTDLSESCDPHHLLLFLHPQQTHLHLEMQCAGFLCVGMLSLHLRIQELLMQDSAWGEYSTSGTLFLLFVQQTFKRLQE